MEQNGIVKVEQGIPARIEWSSRSESIAKLAAALSKAQGQIEAVKKGAENPFFKSKYADLSSVWAAIREALASNGLAVVQEPGTAEAGRVKIATILLHESGEYIRSEMTLPVTKPDAQGYGSAITYGRRYALQSIIGIAPEDDDGNAAIGGRKKSEGPIHNYGGAKVNMRTGEVLDDDNVPMGDFGKEPEFKFDYDLTACPPEKLEAAHKLLQKAGAKTDDDLLMYWESPKQVIKLEDFRIKGA